MRKEQQTMRGRIFDTTCTLEVEHTHDHLHAHVELDQDIDVGPGDKVRIHGDPVAVPFGERIVLKRPATVVRATWAERVWTKITAGLEFTELYEVSFTPRRTL